MEKPVIYAFIDSQNLNLGVASLGWRLDFKKFRRYLKDRYRVQRAFLFIGFIQGNQKLYKVLRRCQYDLVFKPTVKDRNGKVKGNVDAELVLHAAKVEYPYFDKAVFVSSDGDFYCLYKEMLKDGKLAKIVIPNKRNASSLLRVFREQQAFLEDDREKIKWGT